MKRNSLDYSGAESASELPDPATAYSVAAYPEVAGRLALLERIFMADFDGASTADLQEAFELSLADADAAGFVVLSFDIDLTLAMPEDEPGLGFVGVIDPATLTELQQLGCVVGVCSDREPAEQRPAMLALGVSPDFCIGKEFLRDLGRAMPGAELIHVGDDAARDRRVAESAGFEHLWPNEAARRWIG